ncbi:OmpA family protein [Methyloligella solikamskensis]|uniref:OmpA family protein n=1 Tax=Methyloligella solikamskensis TaxID=1177756 RepID=A0ABW3JA88_9HYPH
MRLLFSFFLVLFAFTGPAFSQDVEGASDYPDIGRYEGTKITRFERIEYDTQRMLVDAENNEFVDYEGEVTHIVYDVPEGTSMLQIRRSFEEKLKDAGYEIIVSCREMECGGSNLGALRATAWKMLLNTQYEIVTAVKESDAGTVRVQILVTPKWINMNVVENTAFENKMIDASAVQKELAAQGKMAFYDIHFDTDSAILKSDSDETIGLIAEVIKADPNLKIVVVGHTDNDGSLDYNIDLSRARAKAVADRLIQAHGIAADKVNSAGVAFLAPVTTNSTAEGRALNRRVEIVVR